MFGKNAKVDLELNRDVEQLIKTGGKGAPAHRAGWRTGVAPTDSGL